MRFLLVDRIDEVTVGKSVRGVKNVTLSEDFMHDHFPGAPLFPGTLMVEALAQLGGCLAELTVNQTDEPPKRAMLVQIDKTKFHEPCRPGDQLYLECRLVSVLEGAARIEGVGTVRGTVAVRSELTYVLRTVEVEAVHAQRRELYRQWMRELKSPPAIR